MRLKSIETTPNPHSMKINVDGHFANTITFTAENKSDSPDFIQALLNVDGIKSVFTCNNFLTLNKAPASDWQPILAKATEILGQNINDTYAVRPGAEDKNKQRQAAENEGQVHIFVQTFKNIPIQVKAKNQLEEIRISLGQKFDLLAQEVQITSGADYLKERYWADHGVRYGQLQEVANEIVEELRGTFNSINPVQGQANPPSFETLLQGLDAQDWHQRLATVQALSSVENNIELLARAIKDSHPQVRRLSAAALGTTGSTEALAPLIEVLLKDPSSSVRRTAGDALSDIGDIKAQTAMCLALKDPNKLVRWRAARFLADIGDSDSLLALESAAEDPAFEVRLEIEAAIERITAGGKGSGPAWKRIIGQAK